MKIYKKKVVQPGEMVMYEILNEISGVYNPHFSILKLPKAIKIDYENAIISMPFYKGELFDGVWDSSNGGAPLGLDLSGEVPAMIEDLSKIDLSLVRKNPKLKKIPRVEFNQGKYLGDFKKLLGRFIKLKLITKRQGALASKLIKDKFSSPLIFNNGDFYPRNFIRQQGGKIVLIDWETWNDHSRANMIDHPENVAAYCFVHMWGNAKWQKKFVRQLKKRLKIKQKDFQKSILIKSAEMAQFWLNADGQKELCADQIGLFKKALSGEYMKRLWA